MWENIMTTQFIGSAFEIILRHKGTKEIIHHYRWNNADTQSLHFTSNFSRRDYRWYNDSSNIMKANVADFYIITWKWPVSLCFDVARPYFDATHFCLVYKACSLTVSQAEGGDKVRVTQHFYSYGKRCKTCNSAKLTENLKDHFAYCSHFNVQYGSNRHIDKKVSDLLDRVFGFFWAEAAATIFTHPRGRAPLSDFHTLWWGRLHVGSLQPAASSPHPASLCRENTICKPEEMQRVVKLSNTWLFLTTAS